MSQPLNHRPGTCNACDEARKPAERIGGAIPLARAMICVQCDAIDWMRYACRNCASAQVMPLAAWLSEVKT